MCGHMYADSDPIPEPPPLTLRRPSLTLTLTLTSASDAQAAILNSMAVATHLAWHRLQTPTPCLTPVATPPPSREPEILEPLDDVALLTPDAGGPDFLHAMKAPIPIYPNP